MTQFSIYIGSNHPHEEIYGIQKEREMEKFGFVNDTGEGLEQIGGRREERGWWSKETFERRRERERNDGGCRRSRASYHLI